MNRAHPVVKVSKIPSSLTLRQESPRLRTARASNLRVKAFLAAVFECLDADDTFRAVDADKTPTTPHRERKAARQSSPAACAARSRRATLRICV